MDSSDRERIDLVKDEIHKIFNDEELNEAVFLIFANKQDLPNAMNSKELVDKLELNSLRGKTWHLQACSAQTADGLAEGLDWLTQNIKDRI